MIEKNRHKYSVSALCEVLQIAKSTFYYEVNIAIQKEKARVEEEGLLKAEILIIFNKNCQAYGTRKIKDALSKTKAGYKVSRRRIGRLMKELGIQVCSTLVQTDVFASQ